MLKTQELQILDSAIQQLGNDSYLGPWLAGVRAEVEQSMRADLIDFPTIAAVRAEAESIKQDAKREAACIVEAATRQASVKRTQVQAWVSDTLSSMDSQLQAEAYKMQERAKSVRHYAAIVAMEGGR